VIRSALLIDFLQLLAARSKKSIFLCCQWNCMVFSQLPASNSDCIGLTLQHDIWTVRFPAFSFFWFIIWVLYIFFKTARMHLCSVFTRLSANQLLLVNTAKFCIVNLRWVFLHICLHFGNWPDCIYVFIVQFSLTCVYHSCHTVYSELSPNVILYAHIIIIFVIFLTLGRYIPEGV